MKGNKMFPQCGFSNTAVMILNSIPAASGYETFDVLSDQAVRDGVKTYSAWPTIPQCYIDGEFIGGCDIIIEMYQSTVCAGDHAPRAATPLHPVTTRPDGCCCRRPRALRFRSGRRRAAGDGGEVGRLVSAAPSRGCIRATSWVARCQRCA
jgi:Grx4 family monothiol glutaredoxin